MKRFVAKDFFYAGTYLGKVKRGVFFPSFNLLRMIASRNDANRVMVDQKSEWLFTVGRDIFRRGILKVVGSKKKSAYTLVVNQHGECLGFGRIRRSWEVNKDRANQSLQTTAYLAAILRRERRA